MYEYRVKKVTGVVDGDTIDVELDLGFNISYSQRVRLAGIDTPESCNDNDEYPGNGPNSVKLLS
jgi:micrococcal nuclease